MGPMEKTGSKIPRKEKNRAEQSRAEQLEITLCFAIYIVVLYIYIYMS